MFPYNDDKTQTINQWNIYIQILSITNTVVPPYPMIQLSAVYCGLKKIGKLKK
jgi:hypothetical protein